MDLETYVRAAKKDPVAFFQKHYSFMEDTSWDLVFDTPEEMAYLQWDAHTDKEALQRGSMRHMLREMERQQQIRQLDLMKHNATISFLLLGFMGCLTLVITKNIIPIAFILFLIGPLFFSWILHLILSPLKRSLRLAPNTSFLCGPSCKSEVQ